MVFLFAQVECESQATENNGSGEYRIDNIKRYLHYPANAVYRTETCKRSGQIGIKIMITGARILHRASLQLINNS